MTGEQLSIISSIIGILMFLGSLLGFGFNGLKAWLKGDATEEAKVKWGKIQVGIAVIGFVIAVTGILSFWYFAANSKGIVDNINDTDNTDDTNDTDDIKLVYVSNQLYQGATYSGYVNEQYQPHGKGTMKYSDGKEYKGDWVNGIKQGQGTMKYNNGIYEGEWKNDKKDGKGTYVWNDGRTYEGLYENDVRSGDGVFSGWVDLTNRCSGTYYGESKNDQFNGSGKFFFDNGDKFEGIYKENLYWTGIYTRKDGSYYKVDGGLPQ